MPRHHIVPQMILRRFANSRDQICMHPRGGDGPPYLIAIRKACSEVGFYEIPTDDVAEDYQADHDPEFVEHILADIEGTANQIIADILSGDYPLDPRRRFKLTLFLALQMSRGWSFREGMNQVAQNVLEQAAQARFPEIASSELPTITASKAFAIQHSLRVGVEVLMNYLYFRTWRILRFDTPCLLTSDSPFEYWAPPDREDDGPFGVGNAPIVFFPLDRATVLAMSQSVGRDQTVRSGLTRARQVNYSVAVEAQKWIMHHQDDAPLTGVRLPPLGRFVSEYVHETVSNDGEVRQLFQIIKR